MLIVTEFWESKCYKYFIEYEISAINGEVYITIGLISFELTVHRVFFSVYQTKNVVAGSITV